MSLFKGKILLITGGTGSFGNAVLNGFLETDIKEIRIFSRDEKSNCRSGSGDGCIAACDHKYRLSDPIRLYYQLRFDCRPCMCDRRRRTYFSGNCDQGRKSDSKSNKN